jgi:hypothetical protein
MNHHPGYVLPLLVGVSKALRASKLVQTVGPAMPVEAVLQPVLLWMGWLTGKADLLVTFNIVQE